jgi:hypothetical protein
VVLTGISLLCEWRVISIVGAGVFGVLKVGEAPGFAVGNLIERVNPFNGVTGLDVKSGPEVVVVSSLSSGSSNSS